MQNSTRGSKRRTAFVESNGRHNSARGGRALAKRSWSSSFPGTDTQVSRARDSNLRSNGRLAVGR
jgi:hypothetical protein